LASLPPSAALNIIQIGPFVPQTGEEEKEEEVGEDDNDDASSLPHGLPP
jgi:hypothetical protein